ncbi:MAG: hypothetical protein FWD97_00555 [Defluviitaleaceae bacterium]|nr:hypothetical protein [Defluviitaleaceae bacterium]
MFDRFRYNEIFQPILTHILFITGFVSPLITAGVVIMDFTTLAFTADTKHTLLALATVEFACQ